MLIHSIDGEVLDLGQGEKRGANGRFGRRSGGGLGEVWGGVWGADSGAASLSHKHPLSGVA